MKLQAMYKIYIIILYTTEKSMMTKIQEIPLDALELISDSREVTEFHTTGAHAKLYTTDVHSAPRGYPENGKENVTLRIELDRLID
jgi:hypothetical protein